MAQERQGWDYITETFLEHYKQDNPLHFGTLISWQLGGNDPLEGISVYDDNDNYHFVTYGFSELYDKVSEDSQYSGYGFEMTLRLKKSECVDEEELKNMAGVLQTLGRFVFENGEVFQPNEYIYTGQENGMDVNGTSKITGFATVLDDVGKSIETPNGKVDFIQLVGLTNKELKALVKEKYTVKEILDKLGNTLTDYERDSVI